MKAAVVLTGMVRDYEKCYSNFRSFFDYQNFDYDVFICSWDLRGTLKKGKPDSVSWLSDQYLTKTEKKNIIDTYNPVYFDFENYYMWQAEMMDEMKAFVKSHQQQNAPQPVYNGIFSQYYKVCKGIKLASQYKDYDFIIRWRTDIAVNKVKLTFNDSLLFNKMWQGNASYKIGGKVKAIEDFYIAGKTSNMLIYSEFYDCIRNCDKEKMNKYLIDCHWISGDREKRRFSVEVLLTEFLKEKNINLKEKNIGLRVVR